MSEPTTLTAHDIAETRLSLSALRAELRIARRALDTIEARVSLEVEGKNAEECKARTVLTLAAYTPYQEALAYWEDTTRQIEELEASIELYRDERREREWAVRERQIAALGAGAVTVDLVA
jgi:hypothetical protein